MFEAVVTLLYTSIGKILIYCKRGMETVAKFKFKLLE